MDHVDQGELAKESLAPLSIDSHEVIVARRPAPDARSCIGQRGCAFVSSSKQRSLIREALRTATVVTVGGAFVSTVALLTVSGVLMTRLEAVPHRTTNVSEARSAQVARRAGCGLRRSRLSFNADHESVVPRPLFRHRAPRFSALSPEPDSAQ